ncbi:MAG: AAA family ATPase [Pseudohongiellaceae bacterium]
MTKKSAKAKRPVPTGAPDMKIAVQDFGPIAKGEIDLRPLTVFAGPSNTGKSWMATLIYVLEQCNQSGIFSGGSDYEENFLAKHADHKMPSNPQDWTDAVESGRVITLKQGEIKAVYDTACAEANNIIPKLKRYYGVSDISQLINKNREKGKLSVTFNIGKIKYSFNKSLTTKKYSDSKIEEDLLQVSLPKKISLAGGPNYDKLPELLYRFNEAVNEHDDYLERKDEIHAMLCSYVCEVVIDELTSANLDNRQSQAFYLPADRSGIMRTHSVLISALIRDASRAGLRHGGFRLPLLSGVIGDFLEALLISANDTRNQGKPDREGLSASLEGRILKGKVNSRKSESGYPNFEYQPEGWKDRLPLITASSMISELSPVVLFLRHLVEPGDTLILEEPEAHLHPASQKKLMEEIANWVNNGIKVILTTHSDWILESLSNIVARDETATKKEQVSLNKKNVGVWVFDYADPDGSSKGSSIRKVNWDLDEGGYETGFYDVAANMHNDWAGAVNCLNNQGAKK